MPSARRRTRSSAEHVSKLVFATRNRGKIREATAILGDLVEVVSALELDLAEIAETGETFEENARIKARAAGAATGLPALGDDSGLEVDALGGRPGILSARYGGPGLDDAGRRRLLLRELSEVPDPQRTARFVCAVALVTPDGVERTARGTCEGRILTKERGTGGFGYDRLFVPDGHFHSFGELMSEVKNALSHRGRALAVAREWLRA